MRMAALSAPAPVALRAAQKAVLWDGWLAAPLAVRMVGRTVASWVARLVQRWVDPRVVTLVYPQAAVTAVPMADCLVD